MNDGNKGLIPTDKIPKDKILSTLGLCKKAGKLVMGFDPVAEAIGKGQAAGILAAQDLSPKSRKEITLIADKHGVKIVSAPVSMDEIWHMVGKRAGILGVADSGLAQLLFSQLEAADRVNEED